MFTDSIAETTETLRELLSGLPPPARRRAAKAAGVVEDVVVGIQHNHPKDAAVALGVAFALCVILERLSQAEDGAGRNLIQTLS